MELIQMLVQQLGVSDEQASGGAGLLFKLAQEKLSSGEFAQVKAAVPGVENLVASAPQAGGLAGALGGLASSFGGGGSQLAGLAELAGGFKNLDLDSGMIGKFIPIVLSFAQSKGGDAIKQMLARVLQ
jgi:hypothetical protein